MILPGQTPNILFICSANKDRSKTVEDLFSARYNDISFVFASTNKTTCQKLGTNYLQRQQLEEAITIYVMETKHSEAIRPQIGSSFHHKIKILHIKDHYRYGDKEFIELLLEGVKF
jgi:predicted protein tyrosine phosphatase